MQHSLNWNIYGYIEFIFICEQTVAAYRRLTSVETSLVYPVLNDFWTLST